MATMGKYCKAYLLKNLRQFSRWTERIENVRKEKKQVDGKEVEFERQLTDDDILYLQEKDGNNEKILQNLLAEGFKSVKSVE